MFKQICLSYLIPTHESRLSDKVPRLTRVAEGRPECMSSQCGLIKNL